jgi:hypothetical protein
MRISRRFSAAFPPLFRRFPASSPAKSLDIETLCLRFSRAS